ncbi:MAG: DegT/DnrJ/EryC1/StrS family aminotransferase, partial [bacterium]|nr:DegT/DnrJ/EryC1/StrS family aminotransferase [bacterium]
GGEVIVPSVSDYGGVMPVALLNQVPIPADTEPGNFNMGPDQIEAVLSPRTQAIVIPHISGQPADMDPILELARARNIPVIEDCAQAHGATYKNKPVGTLGVAAAFSTMSGKHHATAAQGGVVFTRDEDLYWRIKRFADRGKPFNLDETSNVRAGLNLNGNDLAAAVGRVQLKKLPGIIHKRQETARIIREGIAHLKSATAVSPQNGTHSAYWFMPILIDTSKLTVDKNTFAKAVSAEGIPLSATYGRVVPHGVWFTERNVFGTSDYPWSLPKYEGDRTPNYPCPNAVEALNSMFVIRLHEQWGIQEARDAAAAIQKVEQAYLK